MCRRAIVFFCFVVATFSLTGCLIIPTNYYMHYSRQNIGKDQPACVVTGKTKREDVLLCLGEPDRASDDETELWYMATKAKGIFLTVNSGGEIKIDYLHIIRFDKDGTVETIRLVNLSRSRTENLRNTEFGNSASIISFGYEPHFSKTPNILPAKTE